MRKGDRVRILYGHHYGKTGTVSFTIERGRGRATVVVEDVQGAERPLVYWPDDVEPA